MEKKNIIIFGVILLWLLILTTINFTSITGYTIKQESWECIQAVCDEAYTLKEMQQKFCFVDEDSQYVCDVSYNGQEGKLPANQINWSNIQPECKQPRCIQEILIRNVNYTITNTTSN